METTKAARVGRVRPEGVDTATLPKRKPGRPRKAGVRATNASLSRAYLDRACAIMQRVLAAPRSKAAQEDLAGLITDIQRRLAPPDPSAPAPLYGRSRSPDGYDVGKPDGSVQRVATLAQAAELYGCKESSLSAMLARGGKGYARRMHGDALIWVRRYYLPDGPGA